MGLAGLIGKPPTPCPVVVHVPVDEGVMDVSLNERGGVHAQGDDGHGYDEDAMMMMASNGLGSCDGVQ